MGSIDRDLLHRRGSFFFAYAAQIVFFCTEDVVEQRGLAGTEVSGKHEDLHGFVGHVPSYVRHGLQLNLMPNACSYTHAPAIITSYSQAPHTSGQ